MKISIIIPVYNEEKTVSSVIKAVKNAKLQNGVDREIIIVNDGSTDGTEKILADFHGDPEIQFFYQKNQGKTEALKNGINHCTGDVLIVQDADLEYSPDYYAELLQPVIDKKYDVVFGSRFLGDISGMTFINRWANIISNKTFNLLHASRITDINTCFKVIPRSIMNDITITSAGFTFETEVTSKIINRGYSIIEIPIIYKARAKKEGKKINWNSAFQMYMGIFKYLKAK